MDSFLPSPPAAAPCSYVQGAGYDLDGHISDYSSDTPSIHNSHDLSRNAIFDGLPSTRRSSSRTSNDDISVLPTDCEAGWQSDRLSSYTPQKYRSAFRTPSSVRNIQLSTTPPYGSSTSHHRNKLSTGSRSSTPRSVRSVKPKKEKQKKEHPLVLLHCTLLPTALSYSSSLLEAVLPPTILENHTLLQEKISPTVLERGVLIAHPRDEYDLLEERVLESLELATPRILQCGHFHNRSNSSSSMAVAFNTEDDDGNHDHYISPTPDEEPCADCGGRVGDGRHGSQRWDIKIYAANGLMRAGAWMAAWREMERVDVEIGVWLEDSLKRELDLRKEEEELLQGQRRVGQESQGMIEAPKTADTGPDEGHCDDSGEVKLDRILKPPRQTVTSTILRHESHDSLATRLGTTVRNRLPDKRDVIILLLIAFLLYTHLPLQLFLQHNKSSITTPEQTYSTANTLASCVKSHIPDLSSAAQSQSFMASSRKESPELASTSHTEGTIERNDPTIATSRDLEQQALVHSTKDQERSTDLFSPTFQSIARCRGFVV